MKIPFFGGKKNDSKKAAKELIAAAYNVYNYRCDVMGAAAEKLHALIEQCEGFYNAGDYASDEFKKASEEMERLMRKHGGMIYPLTFWSDNVDVVVVAGILALTVRSFFIQTFQIPTNSMYPTYFGMTPYVYSVGEETPNMAAKVARKVFKGASNYSVAAPMGGEAFIEINRRDDISKNGGIFRNEIRPTRWLGVLPSLEKVYFFNIGGQSVELAVPADFSLDSVMAKAHPRGENPQDLTSYFYALDKPGKTVQKNGRTYMPLGEFKKGESVLNFDILAGDMLLVDRFTYNFRKPRVGEPIVFRTGSIEGMKKYNGGVADDKYYIKRLAGQGGDTLKIEGTTLMRNNEPVKGSAAFDANANKAGEYPGYQQEGDFKDGKSVTIPMKHYYALGDNSASSLDSRYWGSFKDDALVGKPLVIFYPFTKRWGAAK